MTHLPPRKCLPLKNLTNGFGAVRLTNTAGLKLEPGPEEGGPSSMFQEEGASTDVTGTEVVERASMTEGKGSRTSPENEKPKTDRCVNDFKKRESGIGRNRIPNIASTT